MTEHPFEQMKQWENDKLADNIRVDENALRTALGQIRLVKEVATETGDYELAARWRDEEKAILVALAGYGLRRQPEDG